MPTLAPFVDFPDPRFASADGLIAVGASFHPETLRAAYRKGIFPWPHPELSSDQILWFSPDPRGVLVFGELHVSTSLQKFRRRAQAAGWTIALNRDFESVIRACGTVPRGGAHAGTWITEDLILGYLALQKTGEAHCLEIMENETPVGGIYGVLIDGVFSAESMYFKRSNASKLALLELVDWLKAKGHEWMDIQMVTPVLAQFGARALPRSEFLQLLKKSRKVL